MKEREREFQKKTSKFQVLQLKTLSKQPRNCMISQAHLICQKHSRLFCANSFSALCVMTSKAPALCWTPTPSTPRGFLKFWWLPLFLSLNSLGGSLFAGEQPETSGTETPSQVVTVAWKKDGNPTESDCTRKVGIHT